MCEKQIHVVHVIHHLVIGGMENGIVNLINNMSPERFKHTVVCIENFSSFKDRITNRNVELIALHRSQIGVWKLRWQLFKLFRSLSPDIVHSRNMSGLDAILPARLAGVKRCVHGEHGRDVDDLHGSDIRFKVLRLIHTPFVSRYVTVSKELRDYLMEEIFVSPSRVTQIINGVDTEKFSPTVNKNQKTYGNETVPMAFRGNNKLIIGAVGRLQKVKNYALLINAFAELQKHEQFKEKLLLTIIGDGPELQNLVDQAEALGVKEKIWFAGATSNVPYLLKILDVFVLTSMAEGISNTILEAMASGLPVIATAVGGNVELVQEGRTGSLIETDNLSALVGALTRICKDGQLRSYESKLARSVAVSEFSLDKMVERYQLLYEELMF